MYATLSATFSDLSINFFGLSTFLFVSGVSNVGIIIILTYTVVDL